jgi:peroxiredoxin
MLASDARRFLALNAVVVAVSLDSLDTLRRFGEEVGATYPMGSDRGEHAAVTAFHVPVSSSGYAQRSLFVIDSGGIIRYAAYRYRIREDYPAVLEVLEKIGGKTGS